MGQRPTASLWPDLESCGKPPCSHWRSSRDRTWQLWGAGFPGLTRPLTGRSQSLIQLRSSASNCFANPYKTSRPTGGPTSNSSNRVPGGICAMRSSSRYRGRPVALRFTTVVPFPRKGVSALRSIRAICLLDASTKAIAFRAACVALGVLRMRIWALGSNRFFACFMSAP